MVNHLSEKEVNKLQVENTQTIRGKGIRAEVGGKGYLIGSKKVLAEDFNDVAVQEFITSKESNGETVSLIVDDSSKNVLAAFSFIDKVKENSIKTIQELKSLGVKPVLISGDNKGSVKKVALELGIEEYYSEVLPDEKSGIIKKLKEKNKTVSMVGDGVNDAPALALSDVGFAMSTGADVAMHSAEVTLMRGDPLLIPDAISVSNATYKKIKQNLFWAFFYNVVGIPLAAVGLLNPMIAGGAMALSSVSVLGNSLLLKRWKPKSGGKE